VTELLQSDSCRDRDVFEVCFLLQPMLDMFNSFSICLLFVTAKLDYDDDDDDDDDEIVIGVSKSSLSSKPFGESFFHSATW